ncbi:hypothetical protein C8Q74DRAFT_1244224 [Fomes fomentarius]|nr:hypothetical protein C8Q74DRAFT_1244224 [Fomes fomentarius]
MAAAAQTPAPLPNMYHLFLLTSVRGLQVRLATASSLPNSWLSVPIAAPDHRALGSAMPSATGTNSNRLPRSR